jgi:hypothetical protein
MTVGKIIHRGWQSQIMFSHVHIAAFFRALSIRDGSENDRMLLGRKVSYRHSADLPPPLHKL